MGTFTDRLRKQLVPGRTIVHFDRVTGKQSMPSLVLGPVAGDQMELDHDYVDLVIEKSQDTMLGSFYSDVIAMRLSDIHSVQLYHTHDEEANLHEVQSINTRDIPELSNWDTGGYLVQTHGDGMRPIFRFFPLDMRFQGLKCAWTIDLTSQDNPVTWLIKPASEYQA